MYKPTVILFAVLCAIIASISAYQNTCNCSPKDLAAQVRDARYKYKGLVTNKVLYQGQTWYFVDVQDCCEDTCPEKIVARSKTSCSWDTLNLYTSYTFLLDEEYEMDRCTCNVDADFNQVKKICKGGDDGKCPGKKFVENEICDLCEQLKKATRDDDIMCTTQWDPVCALAKDGEKKTFSNACFANREKAKILFKGECSNNDCCCSNKKDYVCAELNGKQQTFDNACIARCKGARFVKEGQCNQQPSCICNTLYDPYCGLTSRGEKKTFSNLCNANCEKATILHRGECQKEQPDTCICNTLYDPYCAVTPQGEKKTFSNACRANCERATILHRGECQSNTNPCNCGNETKFVCAVTNKGRLQSFQNQCLAKCEGARPIYNGRCL